jgi:hypothetical protein
MSMQLPVIDVSIHWHAIRRVTCHITGYVCKPVSIRLQEFPTSGIYAVKKTLSLMRCQRRRGLTEGRKASRQISPRSSQFAPKVRCVAQMSSSLIPLFGAASVAPFFLEWSMSCQTQKSLVLRHMRERGSITTLIATKRYLCFRLSERIRELERDGHLINHTPVEKNGRRYMAYSLVEARTRAA